MHYCHRPRGSDGSSRFFVLVYPCETFLTRYQFLFSQQEIILLHNTWYYIYLKSCTKTYFVMPVASQKIRCLANFQIYVTGPAAQICLQLVVTWTQALESTSVIFLLFLDLRQWSKGQPSPALMTYCYWNSMVLN